MLDLILYVQVNLFSVTGWSSTKQRIKCLAQGHNAVPPVGLEPTTPQSRVKQSNTEPPGTLSTLSSAEASAANNATGLDKQKISA